MIRPVPGCLDAVGDLRDACRHPGDVARATSGAHKRRASHPSLSIFEERRRPMTNIRKLTPLWLWLVALSCGVAAQEGRTPPPPEDGGALGLQDLSEIRAAPAGG